MNSNLNGSLSQAELAEIHGGGFAYDCGRVCRYFAIALLNGGACYGFAVADEDWKQHSK